jgi:transcriptional regulator with XRE-family HTH domain
MAIQEELDRRHFAEALRSLRRYAGLSRRALAGRAGLPLARVARLEQGKAAPSEDTRARLERAVGCPLYFGKHEQVAVRVGEREARVDVGIAPLIRELWVAGIETILSCQQNTLGRIWVEFMDVLAAGTFLNIVARYGDGNDDLYWRMKAEGRAHGTLPDWEYSVLVEDLALDEGIIDNCVEYSYDPPADFDFWLGVRFPPQDLPVVLQRLNDHHAGQ